MWEIYCRPVFQGLSPSALICLCHQGCCDKDIVGVAHLPTCFMLLIREGQMLALMNWKSRCNNQVNAPEFFAVCTFSNLFFYNGEFVHKTSVVFCAYKISRISCLIYTQMWLDSSLYMLLLICFGYQEINIIQVSVTISFTCY